jgi:hypothetical protein
MRAEAATKEQDGCAKVCAPVLFWALKANG